MSEETFKCGRRGTFGGAFRYPTEDTWVTRHGIPSCSYCGSIPPSLLFEAIEQGMEIVPTDKNYKVYVDVVNPLVGQTRVVSAINHDPKPEELDRWVKVGRKERKDLKRDGWGDDYKWVRYTEHRETEQVKFYFQHLDESGRRRFVNLLNLDKINVGYPGRFYMRPYFTVPVPRRIEVDE